MRIEDIKKHVEEMIKTQDAYLISDPNNQYRLGLKSGMVFILSILKNDIEKNKIPPPKS